MKRRAFLSMMLGAAGAPLVPWRGLIEPVIVLAGRREAVHVCDDSSWCHHPSHFKPRTPEDILADIDRTYEKMGLRRFTATHASIDIAGGTLSLGGFYESSPVITPRSPQFALQGILP